MKMHGTNMKIISVFYIANMTFNEKGERVGEEDTHTHTHTYIYIYTYISR
jgi:hypothetical protein